MYRILYVACLSRYGTSSTCFHRYKALERNGHIIHPIDVFSFFHWNLSNKIRNKLFSYGFNIPLTDTEPLLREIDKQLSLSRYNIVWFDKGIWLEPGYISKWKKKYSGLIFIGYSPDDMGNRQSQSVQFMSSLREYDFFVTTKSYNVDELKSLGCKRVIFISNAFEETLHHPRPLSDQEIKKYSSDISFIGNYEYERAKSISYLCKHDIPVRIYSDNWKSESSKQEICPAVYEDDYPAAIIASKINLAFLRKINRDLQTTRSIEIPACGGFMLAERTSEHLELFREGKEAEFFSSDQELLDKCRYYLSHDDLRKKIALAGRQRCIDSGYSNTDRIKSILQQISNQEGT